MAITAIKITPLDNGNFEILYDDNSTAIVPGVVLISSANGEGYDASGGSGGGGGASTIADGADVAEGHTTDASSASTVIGLLKAVKAAITGTIAVSGTFWQTTQPVSGSVTANAGTNLNTSALALDASVTPIGAKADALATDTSSAWSLIALLKGIYGKVAGVIGVSQSGAWTVQPGNTANTTAWKVDGSAVTQPVSGTVTANAGTNLNTSSLAVESGGHLSTIDSVQGAKTDAANTATDVTSVSIMSVLKQISKSIQSQFAFGYQNATSALPFVAAAPDNSTDSQVSVTTSSGVLLAARAKKMRTVYKNTDATNPVYINFANGTATTSNFPLKAGESIEMRGTGAVKAISTGGTVVVAILEEYYT